ncbi:hypothetical protein EMCRGX_G029553 [Ephydatia muelleri]
MACTTLFCATGALKKPLFLRRWSIIGRQATTLGKLEHPASDHPGKEADEKEPTIPLVPKRRDPHAVLKALASTVTPLNDPLSFGGRSIADPLAPHNRFEHMEYVRAREAGKNAAKFTIHRWPKMFPKMDSVMEAERVHWNNDEAGLKYLIEQKKTTKAYKLYRKLKEEGVAVSLEAQNGLLGLLAYYGPGNKVVPISVPPGDRLDGEEGDLEKATVEALDQQTPLTEEPPPQTQEPPPPEASAEVNAEGSLEGGSEAGEGAEHAAAVKEKQASKVVWSLENHAEKFFAAMPEKDAESYNALLLGLIKFKEHERAEEVFQAMQAAGFQASLPVYCGMMMGLAESINSMSHWAKAKTLLSQMAKEPVVLPNASIFNSLLAIGARSTNAIERAKKIMFEMAHLKVEPHLTTFVRLLRAYLTQTDGSILYDIVSYLEQHPECLTPKDPQDIYFFPSAMSAAHFLTDADLAMRLKKLAMKDNYLLVQNTNFFLSHYLATVATSGDAEKLKEEYTSLVPRVFLPMEWVYALLFKACERMDSPALALHLWADCMKLRVSITQPVTIGKFCGALSKRIDPSETQPYIEALEQAWRKVDYLKQKPPGLLLSQLIRLHCLTSNIEKANEVFAQFDRQGIPPTFMALSQLLKVYSALKNKEMIVKTFDMMIEQGMMLPTTFVRDICWNSEIDTPTRTRIIAEFNKNQRKAEASKGAALPSDTFPTH